MPLTYILPCRVIHGKRVVLTIATKFSSVNSLEIFCFLDVSMYYTAKQNNLLSESTVYYLGIETLAIGVSRLLL